MIPARGGRHRITKAAIGLFTATPAQLPAAGGKVRLVAEVQGAKSCRFSASQSFGALPATRSCGSGSVSVTVTLPKNRSSAARKFRFSLTATGPHSHTTAGPVAVTENAPASASGPPTVTIEPTGRSVSPGAAVSFTAAATGSSAVHWQVSSDGGRNWANVAGANSTTYSFSPAVADSGREYRAVFSNSHGSSHTQAATLTVGAQPSAAGSAPAQVAPALTLEPASVSVTTGAVVSFTAAASGSPAPGVQWQVSTNGGGSWSEVSGASAATFTLTAQLGENGYLYRAVFANAAGTAASNPAVLTVSPPVQGPSLSTQPASQSVVLGSSVTFTATASGSPVPSEQWQVLPPGATVWTDVPGATSTSYTIQSPTLAQDGSQYRAVFTNAGGTLTSNAATLGVATTASAPIVNAQPVDATASAGASVSFAAGATGTPTPSVRWQVSTNGGISWTDISGATSSPLTFNATAAQNGDEYRAIFTNGQPPDAASSAATLTVDVPPQISTQPANIDVAVNTGAFFTASASGSAPLTVQWQVSSNSGTGWTNVPGATSNTYSFTASQGENGNEYRAVFTNPAGAATSNAATLTVAPNVIAPAITGQPSSQVVLGNTTVHLSASASGVPTPTVQWQVSTDGGATWSNVAGATATTYSFVAMGGENGNRYEAVFTNGSGSATTAAATLVVGAYASAGNWAGYTSTATNITMVSGSWIVPTATCTGATTYSSAWVGIDGAQPGATTVEQDGTDSDCQGSTPAYSAWWELYPDYSTPLPSGYTVAAGDSMHGTVSVSGGQWTLSISDQSAPWTFTQLVSNPTPVPAETSAEWIIERPGICNPDPRCPAASLTNFGTIGFSAASATENGSTGSLTAIGASPLQMSSGSSLLALPSLTTGSGFSVTYYNSN